MAVKAGPRGACAFSWAGAESQTASVQMKLSVIAERKFVLRVIGPLSGGWRWERIVFITRALYITRIAERGVGVAVGILRRCAVVVIW